MTAGMVKWFDCKKGYGFIVGPKGEDVFVHYSCIHGDGFKFLRQGEEVEYDLHDTPNGLQALTVRQVEKVLS